MARSGKAALIILLVLGAVSAAGPLLPLPDPVAIDLDSLRQPPSAAHPFGTDNKGRDVLSRVVHGGMISIGVALVAAATSAGIGFSVGLISGYFRGRADTALMALVDFLLSFPSLLLAVAITVVLPPGIFSVMVALSVVGWTSFARLVRGYVLTLRDSSFVEAARALGCGHGRILLRHIAPLCLPLALVMVGIRLGGFVLAEATLSFLGLGAQPPTPTWGAMISASRAYIITAPWTVFFPGAAISLTALCFNLLGEALRERCELKGLRDG